jgi:DNA-binding response OmpR family regulator
MDPTPIIRTCIVADDDPDVREFVTRVLSDERFQVFAAAGGDEAVALVALHPGALLVTDLAMPAGEGIETIRRVRKQYPAVKILAISGAFGEHMLRTAQFLGANASLGKPFTADMLVAAVRALVEPANESPGFVPPGR